VEVNVSDVIVIPTFQRPDFLFVCLDCISKCPEVERLTLHVSVDSHVRKKFDSEIVRVIERFAQLRPQTFIQPPTSCWGNSRNVLLGLQRALEEEPQFVFYVEEDVFVGADFFRWHNEIHRQDTIFCSVASKNPHLPPALEVELGPEEYYVRPTDYAGIGVCFPRRAVEHVVEHATPRYFEDLRGYLKRVFPHSRYGSNWVEQDGLIRRLLEESSLGVAWSGVPRAYHAGFYGYNRPGRPLVGSLDDRIRALQLIMANGEKMNARSHRYKDIEPCNLSGYPWKHQRRRSLGTEE
jgi:hypothetical protein